MQKFLLNYPFSDSTIQLVEGFAAYDGVLNDPIGAPHKGIDYVKKGEVLLGFEVFAMHDGLAYQGLSESWGKFVSVRTVVESIAYDTIYAHLSHVDETIPPLDR